MKYKLILSSSLMICMMPSIMCTTHNQAQAEEYKVTYIYTDWEKTNKPVVDYIESEAWKQKQKELKEKKEKQSQSYKKGLKQPQEQNKKKNNLKSHNKSEVQNEQTKSNIVRSQEKNVNVAKDIQKRDTSYNNQSSSNSNSQQRSLPETGDKEKTYSAQDIIGYLLLGIECVLIGSFLIYKSFNREV